MTLKAAGGRLRFRPRAAVPPELLERAREHKAALLRLLAPAVAPIGKAWPPPGPAWPGLDKLAGLPRAVAELARERPGWSAKAWCRRLIQLAERCESVAPARAAELRAAAATIGGCQAGPQEDCTALHCLAHTSKGR
ncbi:MAG: hypothetical protein IPM13_09995 [Phycisphaerales bacterium]|nr:hypothetical protein [Phycisphaerales bacterium]